MRFRIVLTAVFAVALAVGVARAQDEADLPTDAGPSLEDAAGAAAGAILSGIPTEAPATASDSTLLADDFADPSKGAFPRSSPDPARYVRAYLDGEYQVLKQASDSADFFIVTTNASF